jgi:hypothetical protein
MCVVFDHQPVELCSVRWILSVVQLEEWEGLLLLRLLLSLIAAASLIY